MDATVVAYAHCPALLIIICCSSVLHLQCTVHCSHFLCTSFCYAFDLAFAHISISVCLFCKCKCLQHDALPQKFWQIEEVAGEFLPKLYTVKNFILEKQFLSMTTQTSSTIFLTVNISSNCNLLVQHSGFFWQCTRCSRHARTLLPCASLFILLVSGHRSHIVPPRPLCKYVHRQT